MSKFYLDQYYYYRLTKTEIISQNVREKYQTSISIATAILALKLESSLTPVETRDVLKQLGDLLESSGTNKSLIFNLLCQGKGRPSTHCSNGSHHEGETKVGWKGAHQRKGDKRMKKGFHGKH